MTNSESDASSVANFIAARVADSPKTQRQIANECGFETANLVSMIAHGGIKVPMNRIGAMAKALEVDPTVLLRMALAEYVPDTWQAIQTMMMDTVLTANECDLVRQFREVTGHTDPRTLSMFEGAGKVFNFVAV